MNLEKRLAKLEQRHGSDVPESLFMLECWQHWNMCPRLPFETAEQAEELRGWGHPENSYQRPEPPQDDADLLLSVAYSNASRIGLTTAPDADAYRRERLAYYRAGHLDLIHTAIIKSFYDRKDPA
ncbi:MAG: hypothetical protein K0A93_08825 [Desulfuromonadaceae bacterium]|nr:hypothetical protein [Desulfuromonadaceae bacterium]